MKRGSLAALLLIACGPAGGPDSTATLEEWSVQEELRIGSVDDPGETLTRIGGVEEGPDGRIYVAQAMDQRILIHGPDGRRQEAFGRAGGGPGEFASIQRMGWRGDTLWTWDFTQSRFQLFTRDGELVRTMRARTPPPDPDDLFPRTPQVVALLPDGTVLAASSTQPDMVHRGEITERTFMRLDTLGNVLDTLAHMPLGTGLLVLDPPGRRIFATQPFGDRPVWTLTADGALVTVDRIVRSEDTTFTVTAVRPGGDTIWQRGYPYRPVPLGDELDGRVAGWVGTLTGGRYGDLSQAAAERIVREPLYVPAHRPPVLGVVADAAGGVWLHLEDGDPGSDTWLVLDPTGEPTAHALLPPEASPRWIGTDHLWAAEADELDVPYLVRYRIVRGPPES